MFWRHDGRIGAMTTSANQLLIRQCLGALFLAVSVGNVQSGGIGGVECVVSPQQAAVQIFEYIEDPEFQFDSEDVYRTIFSRKLLLSSSSTSVNSTIRSSRNIYQGARNETPLSRRLAAPPVLITRDEESSNKRGEATVRILSLSARGKIEQRMSITCESGLWKAESFSYGPPEKLDNFRK